MNVMRILVRLALVATTAWGVACTSARIAQVPPEEAQATQVATAEATKTTSSSTGIIDAAASPEAVQSRAPSATASPTATQEAASFEEDCMALCHIPDPNEFFAAGAKPLPATHASRTTCLECHAAEAAPALPATHLGRLDESCRTCHK